MLNEKDSSVFLLFCGHGCKVIVPFSSCNLSSAVVIPFILLMILSRVYCLYVSQTKVKTNIPTCKIGCTPMTKERVSSGVAGLDIMLGGGYVTGRTMLVAGGPGTGKTILSWHFLFEGIANDEKVMLVSLDQGQETIMNDISEFGWSPERAVASGNLTILSGKLDIVPTDGHYEYVISFEEPFLREQPLTVPRLAELINKKAEETKASRIAVDGLGPLVELAGDQFRVRQLVYGFIQDLNSRDNTILLTHELRKSNLANNDLPYFLSDGVLELNMLYSSGDYVRTMRIVKVRGIKHMMKPVMFKISDDGIVAFPEARLPE